MSSNYGINLLDSLKSAHWDITKNIFGNSHATLIGILVQWWIACDSANHYVLESGPSFGYNEKGIGGGLCDAVFCKGTDAVGILEVEGTRGLQTAQKLEKFFTSSTKKEGDLENLRFAVLLLYAYPHIGKGEERKIVLSQIELVRKEVVDISGRFPGKSIIVITLEKEREPQQLGIRKRNEYYWGRVSSIEGALYKKGQIQNTIALLNPNS